MLGFKIYVTQGNSMKNTTPNGSFIILRPFWSFKPNSVFIFSHGIYGVIIKKLKFEDRYGNLWFEGDNVESISLNQIGPIEKNKVIGKVALSISKKEIKFIS